MFKHIYFFRTSKNKRAFTPTLKDKRNEKASVQQRI